MLDGSDTETFHALRLLRDLVAEHRKPIVIWAGAGVSMWGRFPSWQEAASRIKSSYQKFESKYKRVEGQRLFQESRFPDLFELFRQTNAQRYNLELVSLFIPRALTPVYGRFLDIVKALIPIQIVTTNVDEMLEHNLPTAVAVQSSDLERCPDLLHTGTSFVAKLHGSVSSVETTVFTTTDYQRLLDHPTYLRSLEVLFAQSTVVFIGYSLRDKYVLDLFAANRAARPLFGDGPHFLVCSNDSPPLPESIRIIRYLPEPYADHRSSITVVDIVRVTQETGPGWFTPANDAQRGETVFESSYLLSDVTPPGTWTSSQSLVLGRSTEPTTFNAIVGQGFDSSELPQQISTAMHDIIVGLVSFDHVHVPLSYAGRLHELLGSVAFWELVRAGVFRFIYFEQEPAIIFRSVDAVDGGDIGLLHASDTEGKPFTIEEQIRKQIHPAPGRETETDQLYDTLTKNLSVFDHSRFNIPSLTRGTLLHPSIQHLLGMSDAIFPNSLPRWLTFPVIRLAYTIMAGCACDNFSLAATKIGFGSEILVGAAFAASAARDWADSVSSYVLTSRFNSDLGAYVAATPSIWATVLAFRDTPSGASLRREILHEVATNAGGEFVASVNAGLTHIVPSEVMDNARDQLTELMLRRSQESAVVPAVWTNVRNSDATIRLWRARSRRELEAHCRVWGFRPSDLCPCRSGEKLRDCCAEALRAR
jgi:hypothetical protein